ncbi:MAG: hypothetical protein KatS3mg109_0080 [Pirellulaceae bacterium]|nr:MAG: hypothetical protein KatS3mg109_0080 [Pirellulaceae bacterium]
MPIAYFALDEDKDPVRCDREKWLDYFANEFPNCLEALAWIDDGDEESLYRMFLGCGWLGMVPVEDGGDLDGLDPDSLPLFAVIQSELDESTGEIFWRVLHMAEDPESAVKAFYEIYAQLKSGRRIPALVVLSDRGEEIVGRL